MFYGFSSINNHLRFMFDDLSLNSALIVEIIIIVNTSILAPLIEYKISYVLSTHS